MQKEDTMGDEEIQVVETTPEEPEIQEEVVEGEETTETTETEQPVDAAAEKPVVAEETEEEVKTPTQKRIDKLIWEKNETERKFNLLQRLGPDAYYKAYPEERPADYVDPNQIQPEQQEEDYARIVNATVLVGKFKGYTISDMMASGDPEMTTAAHVLINRQLVWEQNQRAAVSNAETRRLQDASTEIGVFAGSIAKELFDKDASTLSEDEGKKVDQAISETLDWMKKTNRGGGFIADAYRLMTMDKKLNDAKTKGATKFVESLRKEPVGHVGGGGGTHAADNFDSMSEKQLAETVDKMGDDKKEAFYKNASPALRRKYPSWPWD
jgi:hypothetical protein